MGLNKEAMTSRERWQAVLSRQKPDRMPTDYWATGEASTKLMEHTGTSNVREMLEKLHVDILVSVGPSYIGPSMPENTDVFGRVYKSIDYGTGVYSECVYSPLAQYTSVEEIKKNYTWPSPDW